MDNANVNKKWDPEDAPVSFKLQVWDHFGWRWNTEKEKDEMVHTF